MNRANEEAYAKINLTLDITGRRPDGYHDIETIMQTVNLYDTVTVCKSEFLTVECNDTELCGENNLAYIAAKRFFEATGINGGAQIIIDKNIPKAAGLGGGSSDAAAVLRALKRLYGVKLSKKELIDIAAKIGADVPFFVRGGTKLCKGIGEELSDAPKLPDCYIAIIKEGAKKSTGEIYKRFDSVGTDKRPDNEKMLELLRNGDLKGIASNLCNVFEKSVPECEKSKSLLLNFGAIGACLSGSGPTVFGIFDNEVNVVNFMKNYGKPYVITKPV